MRNWKHAWELKLGLGVAAAGRRRAARRAPRFPRSEPPHRGARAPPCRSRHTQQDAKQLGSAFKQIAYGEAMMAAIRDYSKVRVLLFSVCRRRHDDDNTRRVGGDGGGGGVPSP